MASLLFHCCPSQPTGLELTPSFLDATERQAWLWCPLRDNSKEQNFSKDVQLLTHLIELSIPQGPNCIVPFGSTIVMQPTGH